ncbi:MAG: hypothetical protein IJB96_01895, partial [Lachnospira sp.]|nr:hypothetical protein [Lachnospira sp.]
MKLKRIIAIVLCFAMVLSTMSFSVFAEDTTATETSNEKIVAAVGETEYTSLGDAVANADGKTVTLLEDVTLTEKIFLENGMNVTIEGGGKTITFENSKYGFAVKESTLTLGVGLNIVAEGQTCPLYVQDGIAITSANIKTVDGNGYSPIMINGGYRADVTINGGDIVAGDASVPAIYWPGEGTLTVKGGKITGATAIYLKSGNLTITDGELVGNGDKKDYEYVVSGSTPTGDALVIENVGVDDYEAVGTVSITGGKFTSLNAYSVASHTAGNEGVEAVTGFISGGNFSSDVSAFVADGFEYDAETGEIVEETLPVNYVAQVGDEYYTSIDDAIEAAKVTEEKVVTALETIILDEDCTLDLMGVRVNAASSIKNAPIFRILADVTVTNGIVDGKGGINCYAFIVGKGETAGTLTIKDGTYRGVTTAVQISNGTVNISGGTFQTGHDDEGTDYGTQYLLNCMDAAYKNGTAKFNITGGKFVGFNPENNAAEGEGTNFLSGDYKAFENDGRWYVTIPNIEMDGIHYATIKDALWTLKSADTTVHKIKVLKDLEIDVNYSTYNYPILVNGFAIKLDLNGKTLTADWSKYTGSRKDNAIIGVANGGKIDIIDSVGGGKIVNNDNREDVENRIFWIMTSTETKSIVVNIKGGTFVQNDVNTALLYVQGNKPSDNLAPIYINITGGHFETVNDDFFNAYDGYQHESYISGGTFNKNPSDWEIKIHPSFVLVENEDGTWGVVEGDFVAKVGDKSYMDFSEALAAANSVEESATIELLKDVTLGEKLEITGNVTISGEHTITRADDYTGTLFVVNADATLTLDGGLVIDGANVWTLNTELYNKALNREVEGTVWADLITSEENAPNATAAMFVVNGAVVAKDVTIQNNYSTKDSNGGDGGIFKVGANASLTMTGANVKHIVTGGANSVAYVASGATWTINEGTLITDTFAARNGGVCRTDGGYIVMNGGIIEKNNSLNTNGTVFMMYNGAFTMNGGKICSNTGISGTNNGRCAAIYLHSNGAFTMNGGEICHNTGISYGGVDTNKTNSMLTVTGGYIGENISVVDNANADVNFYNPDNASITGGKFTQDVSAWLAPDSGLVYDEATGTYGLTQDLYEYNGVAYKSLADVIAAIASTPAMLADEDATPVVKVLASHRPSATIAIDTNIILDLNGKNLYGVTGVNPIIRVLADVTITGNGMIDSANQGDGYCFIVGSSDGPVAGNLTIENGTFKGTTTAVSVTKGTATILDGDFRVKPYQVDGQDDNYNFLLNCIDANYKDGSAKIIVKGGKFTKFNPADNAAEGANTSFVASGHMAVDNDDETWNVIGMVAMIGETKFATLTEAIKTAQANDTITLLADVTEDVTINKSITLDGGNFKYTGNISVSGSTSEVTVKNVNFVNGTGYAVTTNRIKSITVEDCTVSNYAWGFLYANKSTPTVVVKNVTVDGGNYGFHWVYGTSATLENVTMTNVTNGLLIQNY